MTPRTRSIYVALGQQQQAQSSSFSAPPLWVLGGIAALLAVVGMAGEQREERQLRQREIESAKLHLDHDEES